MKTSRAMLPLGLAVVLTVAYKLGDGYVMGHLINSSDKLTSTLVYLTMGSLVGLTINYILCQTPAGRVVDPTYKSVHNMPKLAHQMAAVSGIVGAMSTGIYLWALRTLDPSIVVPLTALAVLYIGIAEMIMKKTTAGKVIPSIILVIVGVGIASFREGASWLVTGGTLLLVLFGNNVLSAIGELAGKRGVDASDSTSFSFWRFFWIAGAAITIAVGTSIATGRIGEYVGLLGKSVPAIPFVVGVMVVVFFANGWANRGMALSNATTKNLVMASQVVVSVFATALVAVLLPGVFPMAPTTVIEWVLRLVGATLLMLGVLRLRK